MSVSQRNPRPAALATQGPILALLALLYFVDLFLPWWRFGVNWVGQLSPEPRPFGPGGPMATFLLGPQGNGWEGAGIVAGVLAALLFLWEATRVARIQLGISFGYRSFVSASLAFGILLFTVIQLVGLLTWMRAVTGPLLYAGVFAWIALVLAVLIALAGLVHWRLWEQHAPAREPAGAALPMTESVTIPPSAPAPESAPAGTCPACGRSNPEDARFCSACGKSLAGPAPRRRAPRSRPPTT